MLSTHAQRLERWIGPDLCEGLARQTKGWHGTPIPLMGVPGRVYVTGAGDFVGPIRGGFYGSLQDFMRDRMRAAWKRHSSGIFLNTGFSSLSDLISEATTGGKAQDLYYSKTSVSKPAAAYCQDLWVSGAVPAVGSNGGAAPGGTTYDNTTTGALPFISPGGADTAHLVRWDNASGATGALMLVDRVFAVSCSHNSANISITGVPGRYQSTEAVNCFISARVTTVLSSTAHNITITYMDQNGNTAEAGTAQAGRISAAVGTIPFTTPQWFYYLNGTDNGVRKITNWATSAANTGVSDVFIAKMLAICPIPFANVSYVLDGINSAFNLVKITSGACLTFMEYFMAATSACTHSGLIKIVSG